MSNFKKAWKNVWAWIWACVKHSLIPLIMYATVGTILFFVTFEAGWTAGLTTGRFWLCFGLGLAAVAYNGVIAFVEGGSGYEMLVTGNIKRGAITGQELKMSTHKVQKEYRVWKGFGIGALIGLITIIVALVLGANQDTVNQVLMTDQDSVASFGLRIFMMFCMALWGWATLPFMFSNGGGIYVSYYWIALLALIPVVVSGIMYIIGAYARRNKKLAAQEAAEREAEEEAAKPKKVNYGGLPGTKPKKKK